MLCFIVNRNKSDSFPANPTAAQATAIDCGEIIFPTTPPEEFAASAKTGSIPIEVAVTFCKLANNKFEDVSEPVINTPSHPKNGEKNGNKASVFASAIPSVVLMPEAFVTYANPTTEAMVIIGNFNSSKCLDKRTSPIFPRHFYNKFRYHRSQQNRCTSCAEQL